MYKRKRLGDMLVEYKLITQEQLNDALKKQKALGNKRLGSLLVELGYITEENLYKVLELQFGIPYFDLNANELDTRVVNLLPYNMADRYICIPVLVKDNRLAVAMSDPLDVMAIDDMKLATGKQIEPVISAEQDIKKAINRYYDTFSNSHTLAEDFVKQVETEDAFLDEENAEVTSSPMVKLVNNFIVGAVKQKASDIHIEPFETYVRVRYRIDGALVKVMDTDRNTHSGIATRIKIMGKMNISERRVPQDGRVETVIDRMPIDMRISVLPTVYGEKIVIRILDRNSALMRKSDLGLSPNNQERLDKILKIPEGIILMTGPTGSGKTTTLYSLLKEFNKMDTNIITVEDPVEYRLDGINQVQVNEKAGLTFASGLRSILRQDPDVVMVGEIRDQETAQIAIRAAITGHVVFSTLHTNDTASTLSRLVDMGIEPFLVATATKGVIAQRLVKRICKKCKYAYEPNKEERQILGLAENENIPIAKGKGCNSCNNTGYAGRVAIHEILIVDNQIMSLIIDGCGVDTLKDTAMKTGMSTLHDSCVDLVRQGITTTEEVVRTTYQLEV